MAGGDLPVANAPNLGVVPPGGASLGAVVDTGPTQDTAVITLDVGGAPGDGTVVDVYSSQDGASFSPLATLYGGDASRTIPDASRYLRTVRQQGTTTIVVQWGKTTSSAAGAPTPDPATLEIVGRDTLVPTDLWDLGWTSAQPRLAVPAMPLQGADGTWSWLNFAGVAPVGGCLAASFATPPGVTGVSIEVDGLMQAPSVGATGPLGWEVRGFDGNVVASGSWSVGTAPVNVSAAVTVAASTGYEVRLLLNPSPGTTPCSCMVQRARVRPAVAADARWLAGVVRVDPLNLLHNNSQAPGYQPTQPAPPFPYQDGFCELRFETTAPWIVVALFGNSASYLGAGGPSSAAVIVGGRAAGQASTVTLVAPAAQDQLSYAFVQLSPAPSSSAPVAVRVRGGEAVLNSVNSAAGGTYYRQTAVAAIYLPASAYLALEVPEPPLVAVGGDSKLTGAGAASPAELSQPTLLRLYGYETLQRGAGGDVLYLHAQTDALLEAEAAACRQADVVALGWARNDLYGSTTLAQSTVSTELLNLAYRHNLRGRSRVWLTGIGTEANESVPFGSGGGTWDGFRGTVQAAPTLTGPSGFPNASWLQLVDMGGVATQSMMASTFWSPDGVHGAGTLQAVQVELMRQTITGGVTSGFSPLSLAPTLWAPMDSGVTLAGAPGPVTGTGTSVPTLTLSGAANRALAVMIRCSTAGPSLGAWALQYSLDGTLWSAPVASAASVRLGGTGLTALIGAGAATADALWTAVTAVAQVGDLSGAGRNLAQAVGADQPAFSQVALNGRPGLVFPAGNASLTVGLQVTVPAVAAWSIGCVATLTTPGTQRAYFGGGAWTGCPLLFSSATDTVQALDQTGTNHLDATGVLQDVAHGYLLTCDGAGTGYLYVDGLLVSSGPFGMTLGAIVVGGSALPSGYHVYSCDGSYADFYLGGYLGADGARCLAALWRRAWGTP